MFYNSTKLNEKQKEEVLNFQSFRDVVILVTCCALRGPREQPVVGQKLMNEFIAITNMTNSLFGL